MPEHEGFSMVEMILIVVILGILAMVAVPRYTYVQTEAREAAAEEYIGALNRALIAHTAEHYLRNTPWVTSGEETMKLLEHNGRQMPAGMTYAGDAWTLEGSGRTWTFQAAMGSTSPRILFSDRP